MKKTIAIVWFSLSLILLSGEPSTDKELWYYIPVLLNFCLSLIYASRTFQKYEDSKTN